MPYDPTDIPDSFIRRPFSALDMPEKFLGGSPAPAGPTSLVAGQADTVIGVNGTPLVQLWPSAIQSDVTGFPVLASTFNVAPTFRTPSVVPPADNPLMQLSAPNQSSRLYALVIKPAITQLNNTILYARTGPPFVRAHVISGAGSANTDIYVDASRGAVVPVEGALAQVIINCFSPPPGYNGEYGPFGPASLTWQINAYIAETQRTLTRDLYVTEPYVIPITANFQIASTIPPYAGSFLINRRDYGSVGTPDYGAAGAITYEVTDATGNTILDGQLPAGPGTDMQQPIQLPSGAAIVFVNVTSNSQGGTTGSEYVLLQYGLVF